MDDFEKWGVILLIVAVVCIAAVVLVGMLLDNGVERACLEAGHPPSECGIRR